MARILMLSYLPIHPPNGGGRVRIRALASHLAERHTLTLVCPPPTPPAAEALRFAVCERGVRGARQLADPRAYRTVLEVARRERPDVILLEYVWQGLHASLVSWTQGVPVLLDAFDVATERFRRAGHPLWPAISLYERSVLRSVEGVFAVSGHDRAALVRLGARQERTSVVPNGVDTSTFRPDPEAGRRVRDALGVGGDERLLLFFGQLAYPPNADAVRILVREIMPRLSPEYRLIIAGGGASPELLRRDGGRVAFVGPVERIQDYVNAADAVVAPIRHGSGTRLKLIETLACGVPAVATPVAAEGLDLAVCGPGLTLADDWDAFAAATRQACAAGRVGPSSAFIESYDWRAIVERMPL